MTRFAPLWTQEGRYPAQADRMLLGALWPHGASWGGDVSLSSGRTVNISACRLAIPDPNGLGSILCVSDDREQVTVPIAPPSGQNRLDMIVARVRSAEVDGSSEPEWHFDFISGDAGVTAAAPPLPVGSLALAAVLARGGTASLAPGDITDVRPSGLGVHSRTGRLWATAGTELAPNVVTKLLNFTPAWMTGNFVMRDNGLVIPVRGVYVVAAQTRYSPPAPFVAATYLALDGHFAMDWAVNLSPGIIPGCGGTDVIRAEAGQLLTMWSLHRHTANQWTFPGANFTYFSASLIAEE